MFSFFAKKEPGTVIGEFTELSGELRARGTVQIQGLVRADIDVDGHLEILPTGQVEGKIVRAKTVRISGRLQAFVQANGVEITKTGKLLGDVETQSLSIEAGAIFAGRSQMNPGENLSVGSNLTLDVAALPQREDIDAPLSEPQKKPSSSV